MTSAKLKEILIKADKQVKRDKFSQKEPATIQIQTVSDKKSIDNQADNLNYNDNLHPLFKKLLTNMTKIIVDTMLEYEQKKGGVR